VWGFRDNSNDPQVSMQCWASFTSSKELCFLELDKLKVLGNLHYIFCFISNKAIHHSLDCLNVPIPSKFSQHKSLTNLKYLPFSYEVKVWGVLMDPKVLDCLLASFCRLSIEYNWSFMLQGCFPRSPNFIHG